MADDAKGSAVLAIVAYSLCSSMMLVVNKLAVKSFPVPAAVTMLQFAFAAAFCFVLRFTGTHVDALQWSTVKQYLIYIFAFAAGIYSNMKALDASNVETIIVFRSCTPLCVAVVEFLFLNRELPSATSTLSLVLTMAGAYAYVLADHDFNVGGVAAYFWVLCWYFLLCFQMTYGKMLMGSTKLSTWGLVLYQNFLSIPIMLALGLQTGDFKELNTVQLTQYAPLWLGLSSLIGVAIGYTSWWCRGLISATSFTLVGVVNKMLSVLVSVTFINQNASSQQIAALLVCLLAGTLYSQPPLRGDTDKKCN